MTKVYLKHWLFIILPSTLYMAAIILISGIIPYTNRKDIACCAITIPLICFYYTYKKRNLNKREKVNIKHIVLLVSCFISLILISGYTFKEKAEILSLIGFIAIIFAGPVNEEIIFRFATLKNCQNIMKTFPAMLVSSLLFSVGHVDFNDIAISFLMGIIFSISYITTDSIVLPVVLHSFANLILSFDFIYNLSFSIYMISIIYFIISIIVIIITLNKTQFLSIKRRK